MAQNNKNFRIAAKPRETSPATFTSNKKPARNAFLLAFFVKPRHLAALIKFRHTQILLYTKHERHRFKKNKPKTCAKINLLPFVSFIFAHTPHSANKKQKQKLPQKARNTPFLLLNFYKRTLVCKKNNVSRETLFSAQQYKQRNCGKLV